MPRLVRVVTLLLVLCLAAGSCVYQSFTFHVPAQVVAGSVFAIEVDAQFGPSPALVWPPAAVFQLPNGFELVGAAGMARNTTTGAVFPFPDAGGPSPPMNFLYGTSSWPPIVQQGHHIVWFSRGEVSLMQASSSASLKVYLRAPATAGSHVLKLALGHRIGDSKYGYPYYHVWPAGTVGFTSMTAPAHVRSIQVLAAAPAPPFALAEPPAWSWGATVPLHVAVGDVDADGRADLVERHDLQLRVLLARPGGWSVAAAPPATAGAGSVEVADLDGDGFGDLVQAAGDVWFGDGGASWSPGPQLPHGLAEPALAVGDVDGDGRADVIFADATGCVVFRANADRSFTPYASGLPASSSAQPGRVLVADLDGDGRAEILMWSSPAQPVRLWRSDGQGLWSLAGTLTFAGAPAYALADDPFVALDLDGDGRREVVRSGSAIAWSLNGASATPVAAPGFVFDRAVALDHDRDGHEDLVAASAAAAPSFVTLWRNVGGGAFQAAPLPQGMGFRMLERAISLRAADVDGDSFPDLVALPFAERTLVWRNTVTGAASLGAGCAGAGMPAPAIAVIGTVAPGLSPTVQVGGALPDGPGLLWAGLSRRTWGGLAVLPLELASIGAPGCTLWAEPSVIVPLVADGAGVMAKVVPLPPLLPTQGLTFFLQGAVYAPGANALQFLFSDGVALKMQ
ncbi:MAG: VCBS repeat-containing protein [Planctomycetes bacterium]|nr:VCBS repeat-containing protein [Planctomycetota bacterium]